MRYVVLPAGPPSWRQGMSLLFSKRCLRNNDIRNADTGRVLGHPKAVTRHHRPGNDSRCHTHPVVGASESTCQTLLPRSHTQTITLAAAEPLASSLRGDTTYASNQPGAR